MNWSNDLLILKVINIPRILTNICIGPTDIDAGPKAVLTYFMVVRLVPSESQVKKGNKKAIKTPLRKETIIWVWLLQSNIVTW